MALIIIYISHHLDEISIMDAITVLRDSRVQGTAGDKEVVDPKNCYAMMIDGNRMNYIQRTGKIGGEVVLELKDVHSGNRKERNPQVKRGATGLAGSGWSWAY